MIRLFEAMVRNLPLGLPDGSSSLYAFFLITRDILSCFKAPTHFHDVTMIK